MQAVADAMEEDKTGALISPSSRAARDARGKSSTLSDEDALKACEITIHRLEEQFAKVEDEMRRIEKPMKSEL